MWDVLCWLWHGTWRLVVVAFWMGAINCTILLVAAMMKPKSVAPVSWMITLKIRP